jgi:hypothetical protein
MRQKLASASWSPPGFSTDAIQPNVRDPVTQSRPPTLPDRLVAHHGRRVNLLRIFRRGAPRVLAPIPPRCNATISDAMRLTVAAPIAGWPNVRLYHNNPHSRRIARTSSVVQRLCSSVHWMHDNILGDYGRVAAGGIARPDGGSRRYTRTGRLEQRRAIGLVRVATLHCRWTHRLRRRRKHVRRDQTRYEYRSSDHSDNTVRERRRRAHRNLVRSERLSSEPVRAFNASYGAGVPVFAPMSEAQLAIALAFAKLKSPHSRDRGDMSWARVGPEGIDVGVCVPAIRLANFPYAPTLSQRSPGVTPCLFPIS